MFTLLNRHWKVERPVQVTLKSTFTQADKEKCEHTPMHLEQFIGHCLNLVRIRCQFSLFYRCFVSEDKQTGASSLRSVVL